MYTRITFQPAMKYNGENDLDEYTAPLWGKPIMIM
jgi:hypothetical protein